MAKGRRREVAGNLTKKQMDFVNAFMADPEKNAAGAYKKAGYAEKSADVNAALLLANPKISQAREGPFFPLSRRG